MLHRPPPDRRRAAAERQKAYRKRQNSGEAVYAVKALPVVIEALIEQAKDAGLTEREAEGETRDRKKVARALAAVLVEWAQRYLAEKPLRITLTGKKRV